MRCARPWIAYVGPFAFPEGRRGSVDGIWAMARALGLLAGYEGFDWLSGASRLMRKGAV